MPSPDEHDAEPTRNPGHDASVNFGHALVRRPAATLAGALTTRALGAPNVERARRQHAAYAAALEALGVEVTVLAEDETHPDSVFIEDAALLAGELAVLTRPGAPSRRDEPAGLEAPLRERFAHVARIEAPGTLDAGDVLRLGSLFLVGHSSRTNAEGARQLAALLTRHGYGAGVSEVPEGLHLKSAVAYLGGGGLLATPAFAPLIIDALADTSGGTAWTCVQTAPGEDSAANCLAMNGRILVPEGYPETMRSLQHAGLDLVTVDVSEFEKLDGGLSCLSLRW